MATHIEGETMQVNDGRDNRQAQAKTTLFIVAAIKALKHQLALSQRLAPARAEEKLNVVSGIS